MSNKNLFKSLWLLMLFLVVGTASAEVKTLSLDDGVQQPDGSYVFTLGEGEYTTYGTEVFKDKTLIFEGSGIGKTIWRYGKNASGSGEGASDYSFDKGANVTFKNLTLKDNYDVNSYYRGFVRPKSMHFENCEFLNMIGYFGDSSSNGVWFKDCVFNVNKVCEYCVKTYGGSDFYFDGCTFNAANKGFIQLYIQDNSKPHNAYVKDCSFNKVEGNTATMKTAVYWYNDNGQIQNQEGADWNIFFSGNNVNNAGITANATSGTWMYEWKYKNTATVYNNGVCVMNEGVAQTIKESEVPSSVAQTVADVAVTKDETATEVESSAATEAVNTVVANTATVNATTEIASESVEGVSSTKNYLHIDVKAAEVAKAEETTYVKSMTFDIKPIAATITDGKLSTEVIPNSAIKSAITFRLPVDANATETTAEVFHNGESMGSNYQVQGTTEKYIEVSTTEFSEFGYQLLDAPAATYVAQIGEVKYETLAAAVATANTGDEIILIADQEISTAIEISKNLTLNLNGKTIINNVASNRLFRVGGATFTIDGTVEGSSMIIPETNKYSFGFVDMRNMSGSASTDAKLILNGGYYEGATLGGAFFKGRNHYQTFELNDVHCKCTAGDGQQYYANGYYYNGDNASVVNSYGYLTTLKVVGGLYEYATLAKTASNVFQGTNFMTDGKSSVSFDNVKVVSSHGPIYELSSGEMTINNCDFTIEGAAIWQNSAICASNNAVLNVNGGKYNAPYAVYALTSGATININGGEFTGSESILVAGTEDSYVNAVSTINVSEGTFTYTGSNPSNAYKTYGNRPTTIAISGGTFSTEVPAEYCAEGFVPTDNGDGTYGVKATLTTDEEGNYLIKTPAELVLFSSIVNEGNDLSGKTVKLANDINMTGIEFTPISQSANWFAGVFDGQGYTIKNLTVNTPSTNRAALFGGLSHGIVKNFTLDNPQIQGGADYTAAVSASGNGTIENVTIKGGSVKGTDQVGGIAGFMIATTIKHCTIDGTTIEATGDRAGGIIGKIDGQNSFHIDNNTLIGVTVKAAAKHGVCGAGGIASQLMTNKVASGMSIKNNEIDVTTITAGVEEFVPIANVRDGCHIEAGNYEIKDKDNNVTGYFHLDLTESICKNHWVPEAVTSTTVSNGTSSVTFANFIPVAQIGDERYATLADAFAAVPTDGIATEIKVLKDCAGNGIIVNAGQNVSVDFGGHTYNVNTDVLAGSNGTKNQAFQLLKNATVEFKNGAIVGDNANIKMLIQNYSNLTLDNMTLDATQGTNSVTYVLSTNNGSTTINNTVITAKEDGIAFDVCAGWGGYTSNAVEVKGESVITGKIEVSKDSKNEATENLTLTAGDFTAATIVVAAGGDQVEVTKGTDADVTAPTGYYWDNNVLTMYAVKVGESYYATLAEAFAAVQDGETITVLKDCAGDGIKVAEGRNFTVDFNGKTYTIDGETVGSAGTQTNGFQLLKNSTLTFKNGTITSTKAKILIQNYSDLTLDKMILDGASLQGDHPYTLSTNNGASTIKDTKIVAHEDGVAFDVCSFGSYTSNTVSVEGDSEIVGPVELSRTNTAPLALNLNGGDFTAATIVVAAGGETAVVKKDEAVEIAAPAGYMWNNNQLIAAVAKIGDNSYATLSEAFAAVQDGEIITVLKDCAGDGIKVAEGRNFTVDFNGKTYTIDGETVGSAGTQTNGFQLLKNSTLTFKNGTITSTKAKILIQNYSNLTLDKMILDGASLQGAHPYTLSTNNGASTIKDTKIIAHEDGVAFDVCSFGSYTSNTVSVEGDSKIVGPVELSRTNEAPLALNLNGGDFSEASIIVADGGEDAVVKKDAEVTLNAPEDYEWNSENILVPTACEMTVYVGNATGHTVSTLVEWKNIQKEHPNAMALVSDNFAVKVAGLTNVIIDYPVGHSHYYECENFELTDGYDWYSPVKEFTAVKGSYSRTIYDGLNAICVPFEIGESVPFTKHVFHSSNEAGTTAYFNSITNVNAGKAFIAQVSGTSSWIFNFDNTPIFDNPMEGGAFRGTYRDSNVSNCYKINDAGTGLQYHSTAMNYAFRGYFVLENENLFGGQPNNLRIAFDEIEDDTTGISAIGNGTNVDVIYNVQGLRLSKQQKGINILNGKKVLK